MRKLYLDNIRWITVVLVVIYHVIYMFNGIITDGTIGPFYETQYQDAYQYVVYPWFMVLLFVVSGMSARYYLNNHTHKEFIKSRTTKLLVPSTIGLFVFWWIMGYYNMAIAHAFDNMGAAPKVAIFFIMAFSGTGVMWFMQLVWLYSLLLVLFRNIFKDKLYNLGSKANVPVLLALTLVIWGSAQILNTPVVVVYRFGIYGVSFFIGYVVFAHDEVIDRLEKWWLSLMIAALACMVVFVKMFWGARYADHAVLKTFMCNLYAWIAVLAIFAVMKKFCDFENEFTKWMNARAWGLYLFHYLTLAICAYHLTQSVPSMPPVLVYILTTISAFGGAFILYAVISRIPFLRWAVCGISGKEKKKEC